MTQTGKCDTCRQRKVKCDEEKPKCGACRKKDRPCTYSYGKASAFVVQDPNQLTKHGKSKTTPVVYALASPPNTNSPAVSTPSDLHVTTEREAENGSGFFQTLAPLSRRRNQTSRKSAVYQRRKLEQHLQTLLAEAAVKSIRPSSSQSTLIARYINILGSNDSGLQPLSILGSWIQSIPSRIGHNRMMDLAVEFLVNSHEVFLNDTYSVRGKAIASKESALKELQLVVLKANQQPTYDVLLATKMHYAAEALMGIDTMYHAIHAFGLAELLKSGKIANVDDEHYWNLIDNTYIDDVNEAMLAGRKSVYDNDFYLTSTYPPPLSTTTIDLSPYQRASMAIMHIFVQCPRLNCVIRQAIQNPDNTADLVAAVTMAESLWQLDLAEQVSPLLLSSVTKKPGAPYEDIADIITDRLEYNSVQNSILCTRYWMLMIVLCGLIDTLHRHFPTETALSLLPDIQSLHQIDSHSAIQLGMSMPWANSISMKLPLVPLRLHTPLQISLGPWHRYVRRIETLRATETVLPHDLEVSTVLELDRAQRMKRWVITECNQIHKSWDVSPVAERPLLEALDTMAGEKIPDWLPVRIRFEAEDGEMVMKLDYENKRGTYHEYIDLRDDPPRSVKARDVHRAIWDDFYQNDLIHETELPIRGISGRYKENPIHAESLAVWQDQKNESMEVKNAADFIHGTGRNLCSTSGWWPTSDDAPGILLDSTHKASVFSQIPRPALGDEEQMISIINEGHPCLASSFWPQTPNTMNSSPSPVSSIASMISKAKNDRTARLGIAWASDGMVTPESSGSPGDSAGGSEKRQDSVDKVIESYHGWMHKKP